jgi:hypothetical protein
MKYITAIGASLVLAGTTFGATIQVPTDHTTIQAAIDASHDHDTIIIAPGTYHEHSLDPGGKAITIQGTPTTTIIDAQHGGTVFHLHHNEGSGTVIKDLVITGGAGYTNPVTKLNWGGAFYISEASPTITGCIISGNTAHNGGGIAVSGGSPAIINCHIVGNTANDPQWPSGGGIYLNTTSSPHLTNCTIENNTAHDGAGILIYNATAHLTNCTIRGNTGTNGTGGGINSDFSTLNITGGSIESNTSAKGAGIYIDHGTSNIANCRIYGNTASHAAGGGGIFSRASTPVLTGTTLCGNHPNQIEGTAHHNSSNTISDTCSTVTGACCYDGLCFSISEANCNAVGGTWVNETCSRDTACPTPCQHDSNNDGHVNIQDLLHLLNTFGACL